MRRIVVKIAGENQSEVKRNGGRGGEVEGSGINRWRLEEEDLKKKT